MLPASFDFASVFAPGSHFDLYFPFPLSPETNRWGNTMAMIGRLKPGVAVEQAQAEIRTIAGADHAPSIRSATASRATSSRSPNRSAAASGWRSGCSPARSAW